MVNNNNNILKSFHSIKNSLNFFENSQNKSIDSNQVDNEDNSFEQILKIKKFLKEKNEKSLEEENIVELNQHLLNFKNYILSKSINFRKKRK